MKVLQNKHGHLRCKTMKSREWRLYDEISWYIIQNLIPFTIIVICYTKIILRHNFRKKDPRRSESMTSKQRHDDVARTARMKMLISMVVVFGVCWFPFNLLNLVYIFTRRIIGCWNLYHLSFLITHLVSKSSACFNPFLYAWLHPEFRAEFRKIFKCALNAATTGRRDHHAEGIEMEDVSKHRREL